VVTYIYRYQTIIDQIFIIIALCLIFYFQVFYLKMFIYFLILLFFIVVFLFIFFLFVLSLLWTLFTEYDAFPVINISNSKDFYIFIFFIFLLPVHL